MSPEQRQIEGPRIQGLRQDVADAIAARKVALEAVARGDEKSSKVVGKRIEQLPLPAGAMIGAIVRDGPGADLKPA